MENNISKTEQQLLSLLDYARSGPYGNESSNTASLSAAFSGLFSHNNASLPPQSDLTSLFRDHMKATKEHFMRLEAFLDTLGKKRDQ